MKYLVIFQEYQLIGNSLDQYESCISNANGDPNQVQICESTYFQWVNVTVTTYVREPTDGLLPKRSQIGQGTSWTNNAEVRELPNNSHNEVRRSQESRDELNQAFDGNRKGGAFFIPR